MGAFYYRDIFKKHITAIYLLPRQICLRYRDIFRSTLLRQYLFR